MSLLLSLLSQTALLSAEPAGPVQAVAASLLVT